MHYGFVPKVGVPAGVPAGVHQMATCVLNLEGVAAKMGRTMGPAIALAAQSRALELSDDWTPDDFDAHDDDAYQGGSGTEPAPIEVEDGHTFLAHVLADAALWMRLPELTFFVSDELIELAISEAEIGRLPSNQYGAAHVMCMALKFSTETGVCAPDCVPRPEERGSPSNCGVASIVPDSKWSPKKPFWL